MIIEGNILEGDIAEVVLKHLMSTYSGEGNFDKLTYAGFFKEGDYFTCFDNTSYSCYVEQAITREKAIKWCSKEIDTAELYFG